MSETSEKTFSVSGMSCGSCELTVREEVEELDFVDAARVDRRSGTLVVRGSAIDAEAVRAAVGAAGYEISSGEQAGGR
jgi:copper chaperone